jgi:hypothetical protein
MKKPEENPAEKAPSVKPEKVARAVAAGRHSQSCAVVGSGIKLLNDAMAPLKDVEPSTLSETPRARQGSGCELRITAYPTRRKSIRL